MMLLPLILSLILFSIHSRDAGNQTRKWFSESISVIKIYVPTPNISTHSILHYQKQLLTQYPDDLFLLNDNILCHRGCKSYHSSYSLCMREINRFHEIMTKHFEEEPKSGPNSNSNLNIAPQFRLQLLMSSLSSWIWSTFLKLKFFPTLQVHFEHINLHHNLVYLDQSHVLKSPLSPCSSISNPIPPDHGHDGIDGNNNDGMVPPPFPRSYGGLSNRVELGLNQDPNGQRLGFIAFSKTLKRMTVDHRSYRNNHTLFEIIEFYHRINNAVLNAMYHDLIGINPIKSHDHYQSNGNGNGEGNGNKKPLIRFQEKQEMISILEDFKTYTASYWDRYYKALDQFVMWIHQHLGGDNIQSRNGRMNVPLVFYELNQALSPYIMVQAIYEWKFGERRRNTSHCPIHIILDEAKHLKQFESLLGILIQKTELKVKVQKYQIKARGDRNTSETAAQIDDASDEDGG